MFFSAISVNGYASGCAGAGLGGVVDDERLGLVRDLERGQPGDTGFHAEVVADVAPFGLAAAILASLRQLCGIERRQALALNKC